MADNERGVPTQSRESNASAIRKEIDDYITRHGKLSKDEIKRLYKKYQRDTQLLDQIVDAKKQEYKKTEEYVKKAAKKTALKYSTPDEHGNPKRTASEVMMALNNYAQKHNWTDAMKDS